MCNNKFFVKKNHIQHNIEVDSLINVFKARGNLDKTSRQKWSLGITWPTWGDIFQNLKATYSVSNVFINILQNIWNFKFLLVDHLSIHCPWQSIVLAISGRLNLAGANLELGGSFRDLDKRNRSWLKVYSVYHTPVLYAGTASCARYGSHYVLYTSRRVQACIQVESGLLKHIFWRWTNACPTENMFCNMRTC